MWDYHCQSEDRENGMVHTVKQGSPGREWNVSKAKQASRTGKGEGRKNRNKDGTLQLQLTSLTCFEDSSQFCTVIRFVSNSAKFGICTVVVLNGPMLKLKYALEHT
jgi:hypothetical protein